MTTDDIETIMKHKQPLVVHILYHPEDASGALPYIASIIEALTKDVRYPFSRTLNLPVFIWNRASEDIFHPVRMGEQNIVLAVTSYRTQGDDAWRSFLEKKRTDVLVLPLALDPDGFAFEGALAGKNAVRLYDEARMHGIMSTDLAVIQVLHVIYLYAFASDSNCRLQIFLSHAKAGGVGEKWAVDVKRVIDTDTTLGSFFDCTSIQPGQDFADVIANSIGDSALVLFGSDQYIASHWCQREILSAREKDCPMIAVDCRESYEDRIFPFVNNMPRLHMPHSDDSVVRTGAACNVIKALMIEVVRRQYQRKRLEKFCSEGIFPADAIVATCPPDAYMVATRPKDSIFVYPDPCVFPEEKAWYDKMSAIALTPYWRQEDAGVLDGMKVGVSISDPMDNELRVDGLRVDSLVELAQVLARQLALRGATLLYGGDLRKNNEHGFTEYLLEEISALRKHYSEKVKKVENHLAWPLSIDRDELYRWKSHYRDAVEIKSYSIPDSDPTKRCRDMSKFLPPDNASSLATWAHCLTLMREKSIAASTLRICAGGRTHGYKGKLPGVLEEILIALDQNTPMLLLGGFGGIVSSVVRLLLRGETDDCLMESWQTQQNEHYADSLSVLHSAGVDVNYGSIVERLRKVSVADLARRVFLTKEQYLYLMLTPFVDNAVLTVISTIKEMNTRSNSSTDAERGVCKV